MNGARQCIVAAEGPTIRKDRLNRLSALRSAGSALLLFGSPHARAAAAFSQNAELAPLRGRRHTRGAGTRGGRKRCWCTPPPSQSCSRASRYARAGASRAAMRRFWRYARLLRRLPLEAAQEPERDERVVQAAQQRSLRLRRGHERHVQGELRRQASAGRGRNGSVLLIFVLASRLRKPQSLLRTFVNTRRRPLWRTRRLAGTRRQWPRQLILGQALVREAQRARGCYGRSPRNCLADSEWAADLREAAVPRAGERSRAGAVSAR